MFSLCKMFFKCFLVLFTIGFDEADFRYSSASCGLPHLQNGRVRMLRGLNLIKFICFERYELVGFKYATCNGTELDVPVPVCVRSGCSLPQIENGVRMTSRQNAWVVFFCVPGHKMIGSSTIYCDGRRWNGTVPSCVDSTEPDPLKCDFEEPNLCGWIQDDFYEYDWTRLNKKTPSSFVFTGPSYDHTMGKGGSGYYMYIESSFGSQNDTARLISPIFYGPLAKNGCFVFYYHMFGNTTGGLRVYEKPQSYALDSFLSLRSSEKQKYILFEKWGNQGDVWYEAVLPLTDFSDYFQIIIEGIRGSSYTGDIAIDDVAILQGNKCIAAKHEAATPSNNMPDSCADRCGSIGKPNNELGCGCTGACVNDGNCCPDFFDLCMFSTYSDDNASNTSVEIAPQTKKLVATTPQTTSITRSSTPIAITKTTPAKTSTTYTTVKGTATPTISTTTSKPTTKTSTNSTTTFKKRTLVFLTTTLVYKITENTQNFTVFKTSMTPKLTIKTTQLSTTKMPSTSTKISKDYQDMTEKSKMEHEVEQKKEGSKIVPTKEPKSCPRSLTIGLIIILIAIGCCAGLALLIVKFGSTRGRFALARSRAHVCNPEVRYVITNVFND